MRLQECGSELHSKTTKAPSLHTLRKDSWFKIILPVIQDPSPSSPAQPSVALLMPAWQGMVPATWCACILDHTVKPAIIPSEKLQAVEYLHGDTGLHQRAKAGTKRFDGLWYTGILCRTLRGIAQQQPVSA